MKNFINNKFNLIIILLVAIILGFGSNVNASFDFTYNDVDYSLPDVNTISELNENSDYIIFFENGSFYLYIFNDTSIVYYNNATSRLRTSTDVAISAYVKFADRSYWSLYGRNILTPSGAPYITNENLIYTTFNIKNQNNEVVFQVAPPVEEIPDNPEITETQGITTTLVEQATQAEMGETLLETIKTYLIYLVIFVVSLIAIYKAVRFLRNALRTS